MKVEVDVHPLIAGVIAELPKAGEAMTARRRQEWMSAFEGILGLLYPDADAVAAAETQRVIRGAGIAAGPWGLPQNAAEGLVYRDPAPDAARQY
jgi:hypothetical protein